MAEHREGWNEITDELGDDEPAGGLQGQLGVQTSDVSLAKTREVRHEDPARRAGLARQRRAAPPARRACARHATGTRWLFIWPAVLVVLALDLPARRLALPVAVALRVRQGRLRARVRRPRTTTRSCFRHRADHFLGDFGRPARSAWARRSASSPWRVALLVRYARGAARPVRARRSLLVACVAWSGFALLSWRTLRRRPPGSLVVTLIFVVRRHRAAVPMGLGLAVLWPGTCLADASSGSSSSSR